MNKYIFRHLLATAIIIAAGEGCASQISKPGTDKAAHNPVLNIDFPDPTVININGIYYAYATNAFYNGKMVNIQVASSTDLFNWKYEGDALPQKPSWASTTQDFWAPDVLYDSSLKKYVMFYCAKNNDTTYGMCIGVAFSLTPSGPFIDKDTPLMKGKEFKVLDPMAMIDPKTKKKIMYWGSDFAPISVTELTDDWRDIAPGNKTVTVLLPNQEKEYNKLVEGAWLDYHEGKYYLYYSGDNCCGDNANYAVMVARADNAFGPFTRLGETRADSSSVILAKDSIWYAPGHNSIVHDEEGNIYIAYHAIWKNEADKEKQDHNNKYVRRVMCIEPVEYKNGWPIVMKEY